MKRKMFFLFLSWITGFTLHAQVTPLPGDTIHYTQVLFSFPQVKQAESYTIEISEDAAFKQRTVLEAAINAQVCSALSFGKKYFWHYTSLDKKGKPAGWSKTFSFYIAPSPYADPALFRYTGKKKDRKKAGRGILFMDYGRVATNRGGKVCWYLADFPFLQPNELVRDLRLTPEGTVTGLIDSVACEMDLNGHILWQAPDGGKVNGEKSENYHHDFKKLPNGNYMVLGNDHVFRKVPGSSDSVEVEFGTVIEYDKSGKIVWSWNSKDYFTDADLFTRQRADKSWDVETHMNAFCTDGKSVMVGFRDISRIVVIDKASKKVTGSYGGYGVFSEPHSATGFFRRQHDIVQLKDGNLAVLNNDSIMDRSVVSSLVIFSPMSDTAPSSQKLFTYRFDFDTLTNGKSPKMGNLQEIENGNILINMGGINRCIEISRSGELAWDMFMERYDTIQKTWAKFPQYRVNEASSLYPYLFRSKIVADNQAGAARTMTVRIYNIGDHEDTYTVGLWQNGHALNLKVKPEPVRIAPGESAEVKISFTVSGAFQLHIDSANSQLSEDIKP